MDMPAGQLSSLLPCKKLEDGEIFDSLLLPSSFPLPLHAHLTRQVKRGKEQQEATASLRAEAPLL